MQAGGVAHKVLRTTYTPPTYVTAIPRVFEAEVFTGRVPFLSPN